MQYLTDRKKVRRCVGERITTPPTGEATATTQNMDAEEPHGWKIDPNPGLQLISPTNLTPGCEGSGQGND